MRIMEEEYREAYLLWKEQNPSETHVQQSTLVTLSNGKGIPLGRRISMMKLIYKSMQEGKHYGSNSDLTEEQISWWTEQGLDLVENKRTSYTEEEYREAYLLWKKQNSKKRCPLTKEIVTLPSGKKIPLGLKINRMKLIYKSMQEGKHYRSNSDLTEEQISWWKEQGIDLGERISYSEEEYREAYLLWKEQNQSKTHVQQSTIVTLSSGKGIPLGRRISMMKIIYKSMQEGKHYRSNRDLTEEQISWWTEQGLDLGEKKRIPYSEEEYREAYLLWKKQNPSKIHVSQSTIVTLSNGKKIPLGERISMMKIIYKSMQEGKHYRSNRDLTEEQISWWMEQGLNLKEILKVTYSEEEYRKAYLIWKKQNPREENVPHSTVIELANGKGIPLGTRISIMKLIYHAMKVRKHHGRYKDLTEEQIDWWTRQGISFERQSKRWMFEDVLTDFNIDFEEFIRSLESAKESDEALEVSEDMKKGTLKSLCRKGGYSYDIVLKASKLHKIIPNDTLEKLINKIMISNSDGNGISSWVYDTYGIETIGILLGLNLNAKQILKEMSRKVIPLEEALCNQILFSMCKEQDRSFLGGFYQSVIRKVDFQETEEQNAQMIAEEIMKICERNQLAEAERTILQKCLFEYLKVLRKYQIMDVSRETDSDKKQRKIRTYNLTEEEITMTEKTLGEVTAFFKKMLY